MGKLTICIGENKATDQLHGNREANQRLCFPYTDSKIPLLKSKMSSFWPASVTVQAGLCWTWSEPKLLVFSCTGSLNKFQHIFLDNNWNTTQADSENDLLILMSTATSITMPFEPIMI